MENVRSGSLAFPTSNLSGPEIHRFAKIIEQFLIGLSADSDALAFAQKHTVSFRFNIKDTDIVFYLSFVHGQVISGMGEPSFKPDVRVRVDADTFDGIFTKRVDGVQAFKTGKISLSGNFLKAMAILKMDFSALYQQARDTAGSKAGASLPISSEPVEASSEPPAPVAPPPPAPPPAAPPPAAPPPAAPPSDEKFSQILEEFLHRLAEDPGMQAFARGKSLTYQFTLKDTELNFYMVFDGDHVQAGLGDAPVKPDAIVRTTAETIDAMFTGRIDAMAALKSGKLSVGGNLFKALPLSKLHFGTLYRQVCAELGAPDLKTGSGLVQPAETITAKNLDITAPGLKRLTGDIRDQILQVNNELFARGWITSTGGNISARSESNPEEIWITPSAIFKGDLRADYMVKIDLDGNILEDSPFNASSERRVHCTIYRLRPDVKAIIHTHALYSTLMALTGTKWLPISSDAAFLGEIPVVPFILPGTPELGEEAAKAIGEKGVAAIMQNHGLVVAGSDLRRAADTTEAIELTAQKLLYCRQLGIDPAVIPDDLVEMLKEMGSMMA